MWTPLITLIALVLLTAVGASTGVALMTTNHQRALRALTLLRHASDPTETTLFDREVYRAVLDSTEASHAVRQEVWRRFNSADQAVAAARGERRPSTHQSVWMAGTGSAQEMMTAPLQTIDTERSFVAHLRYLVDYSTLSTRTLHKAVDRRVTSAPGHSTLVGWLKGDKLPAQLSEPVLRAIVEVLASNIVGADPGVARHVADEHVKSFRMLLQLRTARQGRGRHVVRGQRHRAGLHAHQRVLVELDRVRVHCGPLLHPRPQRLLQPRRPGGRDRRLPALAQPPLPPEASLRRQLQDPPTGLPT